MQYSKLRQEVLSTMRGKLSQLSVSKRMGFNFNQVYRWENGRTRFTWSDFVDFARACRRDLQPSFHHILGFKGDLTDSKALIEFLFGTGSSADIAKASGRAVSTTKKWISGKASPAFEEILEFIDRFQMCLPEVIEGLADISKIQSLGNLYQKLKKQKETIYRYPQLEAISVALSTETYLSLPKHVPGVLAQLCGISAAEEAEVLRAMKDVGLVLWENEKYEPADKPIDTQGSYRGSIALRKYWTARFMEFLNNYQPPQPTSLTGYYLFSLSEKSEKEISKAYYDFLAKAKAIFTADEGPRVRVKLVAAQVLDLEGCAQMIQQSKLLNGKIQAPQEVLDHKRRMKKARRFRRGRSVHHSSVI